MTPEEILAQNAAYEKREKAREAKWASKNKIIVIAKEHPGFAEDIWTDEAYYI